MAAEPVPGVLGPVPTAWRASAQVTSHAPGVTGPESTQGHQSAALSGLIAAAAGPVGALVTEATRLARSGEPVPGALDALQRVDGLVAALALAQAGLTAVAKAQATRRELGGERSFGDWRSRTTRLGRGAVLTQERTAETLTTLPAVHDAVADGGLTFAHAQVLAQALAEAGEKARKHLGEHVEEIVAVGRTLTVAQLRQHLSARVDALEADAADDAFHAARARRFLTLTTRGGGVAVEGFLDPVAGATVRTALEALTPVPGADDSRTGPQRTADALVLLADRALSVGDDRLGAQLRPHLSVLIREDTWALLTWRRRLLTEGCGGRVTRDAFGRSSLAEEPPLAQLLDGTLLPFAALDVLACDAFLQRTVIDPAGVPLDLGRRQRTFSDDLRRAVLVRDRHCQWPGCTLRASWCQVHHIRYWSHDGDTSLPNGIALCSNHHHRVHELGIAITAHRGGFTFTHRDGRALGRTSRLHDDLLVPRRRTPEPPGGPPERFEGPEPTPDAPGSPPGSCDPPGESGLPPGESCTPPTDRPVQLW